jgi:acetyl-CoA carboxylase biotin carboxyl carrier protein
MAKKTTKSAPKPNSSEMKTSEIRDLIDFISKSGLNEVNIETNELKLNVKREPDQKVFKSTPVIAPMAAAPVAAAPVAAAAAPAAKAAAAEPASGKKTY